MAISNDLRAAGAGDVETTAALTFGNALHEILQFMVAVTNNTALLKQRGLKANEHADGQMLIELCLCRLIDVCLTYVSDALRLVYQKHPGSIKESTEKVDVKFAFQFGSMDELFAALLDQKVHSLSYRSLEDLDAYIEKNLGISLFDTPEHKKLAGLFVDARNLIVHNAGIVNGTFQQKQPDFPAKIGERIRLGGMTEDSMRFMVDWIMDLDVRLIHKFGLAAKTRVTRPDFSRVEINSESGRSPIEGAS